MPIKKAPKPVSKGKAARSSSTAIASLVEVESRLQEIVDGSLESRIDLYGEIQEQIDAISVKLEKATKPYAKQIAELRARQSKLSATIQTEMADGLGSSDSKKIVAKLWLASIGKMKSSTEIIDQAKIWKFLGMKARSIAQFRLGDLRDYLTKEQFEQITETTEDGPRSFKIERRKK